MVRLHIDGGRVPRAISLALALFVSPARAVVADSASPAPIEGRRAEAVVQRHDVAVGAPGPESGGARHFKGTYSAEFRERRELGPGAFELYTKAPDRWVVSWSDPGPGGVAREGFNQASGWTATRAGVQRWTVDQAPQKRRDVGLYMGARLEEAYSRFILSGEQELAGRLADRVKATPAEGGPDETLYFDRGTGLLIGRDAIRKVWITDDLFEDVPFSYRYDDYRAVGGTRVPFAVHADAPLFGYQVTLVDAATGTPIEDARFDPPTPAAACCAAKK
jgi:hypothetical protein